MITLPACEAAVIRRHLDAMRAAGCTDGSIRQRRYTLTRLRRVLGVPLTEATPRQLEDWAGALSHQLTTGALYTSLSHARLFYRWAAAAGLTGADPAAALPVPKLSQRLPRPAAEPALQRALADAPPRIRPWLALAAAAGLRAREIAFLRRQDVRDDAEPPFLLVSAEAGKGRKERAVPISPWLLAELRPHLGRRGYLFPRCDGQPGPNGPWRVSHLCSVYLHDSGFGFTLHQLRHRFATTALDAPGSNLRIVQDLLGHASPATTAIYTRVSPAAAAAVVAAMPIPA